MNEDLILSNGQELTSYLACAYAEGFCEGEGASGKDQLKAWAYLIRIGRCWTLQGWFGRAAANLIERGLISKEGVVDWEAHEDSLAECE